MLVTEFDFHLPPESIAQTPSEPRDHARLMVVNRALKKIEHSRFFSLIEYLKPGDVLVRNNSKVFKARLFGLLHSPNGTLISDKTVELFLVRPMENKGVWKALARPGKKLSAGYTIRIADDFSAEVVAKEVDGTVLVQFSDDQDTVRAKANQYGDVPLPPYVHQANGSMIGERYQTVYAKHEGSVAAPTAGFHFTPELITRLETYGVEFVDVTLHVGLGTFLPVKTERIDDHRMHSEWVELSRAATESINRAKHEGRRVIAVGTTSVRVLEGVALYQARDRGLVESSFFEPAYVPLQPFSGDINIFITPGFRFQVIDALITNFHLPKSTLLMLVSAFIGDTRFTLDCYGTAVEQGYRFYSFGDAMLIA